MTNTRFTELLNLCLDHEITPTESAELEAEIQRDPARRQQYRDYCRMQRACAQLFEREHASAPASFALEKALLDAERKVAAPTEHMVFRRPLVTAFAGFAAMAACVTFVLVRTAPLPVASGGDAPTRPILVAVTHPVPPIKLTDYAAASGAPGDDQAVSLQNDWPAESAPTTPTADSGREPLGWMQQVELTALMPVPVEQLMASTRSVLPSPPSGLRERRPAQANVEFIGFQFQR